MRVALAIPLVLTAACASFTASAPFHFGETAATLREGEHAITAAAGVGTPRRTPLYAGTRVVDLPKAGCTSA